MSYMDRGSEKIEKEFHEREERRVTRIKLSVWICLVVTVFTIIGCGQMPNNTYNGSVTMHRRDGKVTNMEIKYTNGVTINVRNKAEADAAILQLEKTARDLKSGREEMAD